MAILYSLVTAIAFTVSNIFFRLAAKDEKKLSALSSYGFLAGLFFIPLMFFDDGMRIEITPNSYFFIGSLIGWTVFQYLIVWLNNKIEASTNALLSQTVSVFSFILGIVLFAGSFSWMKFLGVFAITTGNSLLFVGKSRIELDKAFWVRTLLSLTLSFTYLFDSLASPNFGLPIYAFIAYTIPSAILMILTKTKVVEFIDLLKRKFFPIFMVCVGGAVGYWFLIKAYSFDNISVVIPVVSSSTILTVVASGIFLKEREGLLKKIVLAILVFGGVVILGLA